MYKSDILKEVANYKLNILDIEYLFGGFYLKSLGVISRSSQWYVFYELKPCFSL